MTITLQQAGAVAAEPGTISAGERRIDPVENVLPRLLDWRRRGLRTALATLVAIDGSFPRALGAQMAIAEDGSAAGYISGGCLEGALISEAQDAMAEHKNRLVRYGKGSKYFDIVLPCGGSGAARFFRAPPHPWLPAASAQARCLDRRRFPLPRSRVGTAAAAAIPEKQVFLSRRRGQ